MYFSRKLYLAIFLITLAMAGAASAQTISIVSGDGQLTPQFQVQDPMVVVVKDAQGKPLSGVTVNWTTSGGQGNLTRSDVNGNTVTDANGQTSNQLVGGQVSAANYIQIPVGASIANSSVQFVETVVAI